MHFLKSLVVEMVQPPPLRGMQTLHLILPPPPPPSLLLLLLIVCPPGGREHRGLVWSAANVQGDFIPTQGHSIAPAASRGHTPTRAITLVSLD